MSLFGNDALFKFGLFGSYKQRDYDIYSTQITVNSGVTGNADELLFPENIWSLTNTNGNHIDLTYNLIQQGKSFDASQNNYAVYSSL